MLSVLVRGSGVTTKFAVDLCTLNTTIDREGSYDLFKDDKDYTDISSKPLKSDDDIHQERKQAVRSALEELLNPTLIEE